MTLKQRYRRLTLWNKVGFWGSIASVVGLLITLLTIGLGSGSSTQTGDQSPIIKDNKAPVEVRYNK